MPITIKNIRWGSYGNYEGPVFYGQYRFKLSKNPSIEEKIVYAMSSTEGNAYDAINAYDKCIMTVGIIQWCDKFHLMTQMLGYIVERLGKDVILKHVNDMHIPALLGSDITFNKNANGSWRWYLNNVECSTPKLLRALYYAGGTGIKGSWTKHQKLVAKSWVVALARVWDNPQARALQTIYTASKLNLFVMKDARDILHLNDDNWNDWVGAVKTFYLSYAANNPKEANRLVKLAFQQLKEKNIKKWSKNWCLYIIQTLVLKSKFKIWPDRYNRSRDEIESLYGIQLPKTAKELAAFSANIDVKQKINIVDEIPPVVCDINKPLNNETSTLNDIDLTKPLPHPPPTPIIRYRESWSLYDFILKMFQLIYSIWIKVTLK